jgi:hypothetical protein
MPIKWSKNKTNAQAYFARIVGDEKKEFLKLRKQIRAVLGQEAVVKTLAAVNKPSRFLITKK